MLDLRGKYGYTWSHSWSLLCAAPLDWLLIYRALADRRMRSEPHADAIQPPQSTSVSSTHALRPSLSTSAGGEGARAQSSSSTHLSPQSHSKHSSARLTLEQFVSIYEFSEFMWTVWSWWLWERENRIARRAGVHYLCVRRVLRKLCIFLLYTDSLFKSLCVSRRKPPMVIPGLVAVVHRFPMRCGRST